MTRLDAVATLEERRERRGRARLALHPHRERRDPAQDEERGERPERGAGVDLGRADGGDAARRDPTTTPAITSLWPDRYFVADSITRSAPCSSGRHTVGEANVLSTVSSAPCRWATSASAGRSARTQVGLAMVSTWRIRVGAAASGASTASTSVVST